MVLNVTDAVYPERQPADHSAGCPVSCVKLYSIMVYPHGNCSYNLSFISGQGEAHGHAVGLSFLDVSFGAPPATQPVQRILQAEVGSMRISHGTLISYFSAVSWAA